MPTRIINFWKQCSFENPPFAHPKDVPYLDLSEHDPRNFEQFVTSKRFGDFRDSNFHLSLLPVPYVGDLRRADVFILLLNPGFSYTDYWAESKVPAFRQRLLENLQQSFKGVEFPFLYLDPEFCWHSGFVWWEGKLRDVITAIALKHFGGKYRAALSDLSRRLACVELIPYHSFSFHDHKLITQLPSVKEAKAFVTDSLVPEAIEGRKTLIVTRQVKSWGVMPGVTNSHRIIIYEGGHTRGASLSHNSEGGKAILQSYDSR